MYPTSKTSSQDTENKLRISNSEHYARSIVYLQKNAAQLLWNPAVRFSLQKPTLMRLACCASHG
jgi:hypothetical protein